MRTSVKLAALAVVVGVVGVSLDDGSAPGGAAARPAGPAVPPAVAASTSPTDTGLLMPDGDGDGDSWRDTQGREYRLGLVNTPEHDECFGAEATAERKARTAGGFRAGVYETDRYGRAVAVVTTADGRNLNVHLARNGFADDRYLAGFRAEHEELARQLDDAFAAARQEGVGLWSACAAAGAPPARVVAPAQPAAGAGAAGCHPDYRTCVPVRGDGSGRSRADDLDCGGVPGAVQLRQPGVDPYRFDADGDGVGCDS